MNRIISLKNRYPGPIYIRLFGEFLTGITGGMLAPFLIIYINNKLGGNLLTSMAVVGMQPLTEILFTIFAGGITDRFGRKKIILIALICQALTMAGFAVASEIWMFISLYILNGLCRSLYIPAARAQIADITEKEKLSEIFAVISTIGSIGFTFGPALGYLVYAYHPAVLFAFESAALFLYTLVFWLKVPETTPIIKREVTAKQRGFQPRDFWSNYYPVLILMVLTLPISFFHAQNETNYRIYAGHLFENYLSVLAILSTCQSIMMLVSEIAFVKWTEKWPMTKIIVITYGCYTVTALIYGYSNVLWMLILAQGILTMGQSIGLNHLLRFVSELAPPDKRGLCFAIYGSHWDISRMIGPVAGGMIMIHWGGNTLFYLAACFLIAGGIGQFAYMKWMDRGKNIPLTDDENVI